MTIQHNPGCRYHQNADTCHNNADNGVASPSGLRPSPGYRFSPQPDAPRQDMFREHKHQLQPINDAQMAAMQRQIDALNQQLQQAQASLTAAQKAASAPCPACAPPAPCPNCPPSPQCPTCDPPQACPACPACGNPTYVVAASPIADSRTAVDAGSTATFDAASSPRNPRSVMGSSVDVNAAGDPGMFSSAALPFGNGSFGQQQGSAALPVTGDYSANPAPGTQDYKPVSGMASALAPQGQLQGTVRLAAAPIVPEPSISQGMVSQLAGPAQQSSDTPTPSTSIRGLCSSCKAPVAVTVPANAKAGCMVGYSCPGCGKASIAAVGAPPPSPKNKYFKDMRVKRLVKQFKNKKITYDQLRTALQRTFGMSTVEIDAAVAGRS